MQFSDIPQTIVARVLDRRGRLHVHEDVDPARTALVVIDMQNCFLREDMAFAYLPGALDLAPLINKLAGELRKAGGKVFWVRNTIEERMRTEWSTWFAMTGFDPERAARREVHMMAGAPGHEIHEALDVHPEDEIADKYRFSAFIQGASDIDRRLRDQGIDTLIIAGVITNVCCESSARDAMMLNYRVIMTSDATQAVTTEEQLASLSIIYSNFGDVMDTEMIIKRLQSVTAT
ncbi:cysteine hydrolase [Aquamicrobium sp. LC103]|uniref:cysteine hydrolase n=1 Tax=Aquamicrobium sp. LC103 TaxID=1120658 RepID=UPI00063E74E3|nr:cysteine hydrolase [Aquamicrobium sp. LC103]